MKLNMAKSSKDFLRENCPKALKAASVGDALNMLFDLIEDKGFGPPHYDEYNDFGREAQRVYDDLYLSN